MGLHVLSGGRIKDQHHIIRLSHFIDAVNAAPKLDINMPRSKEKLGAFNAGFKMKSTNEIISGCVGMLDKFFQHTNKHQKKRYSTC